MAVSSWLFIATPLISTALYFAFRLVHQRAFESGVRHERRSHDRHLERLAFEQYGIHRRPGETMRQLRERAAALQWGPGSRAHSRALLENMKPVGVTLEQWIDGVLGKLS